MILPSADVRVLPRSVTQLQRLLLQLLMWKTLRVILLYAFTNVGKSFKMYHDSLKILSVDIAVCKYI